MKLHQNFKGRTTKSGFIDTSSDINVAVYHDTDNTTDIAWSGINAPTYTSGSITTKNIFNYEYLIIGGVILYYYMKK